MPTAPIALSIVFVLLYFAFLFWYGGKSKPLSESEVESLLAEIKHRAGRQDQTDESPLLQQFRELTKNDDGREYYMVNLLKFRKKCISHGKPEHQIVRHLPSQHVTLKERFPATEGSPVPFGRFFAAERASAAQNDMAFWHSDSVQPFRDHYKIP